MQSPHQLEGFVQRHERNRLAGVFHNAPIFGRSVAWRVFGADKGRGDHPLEVQGRPDPIDEGHGSYFAQLDRRGAALVAGCGRARNGLGHLCF